MGVMAVEMEAAALYMNAAPGREEGVMHADHLKPSVPAGEHKRQRTAVRIRTDDGDRAGIITVQGKGVLDDMEMQEILRHVDHTLLSQTLRGKRSRRCATTPSPMGPHRYAFPHLMLSRQRNM